MLIECPSCSAGYEVPERCRDRRVRCARCGGEWRAAVAAPAVIPMADATDAEPFDAALDDAVAFEGAAPDAAPDVLPGAAEAPFPPQPIAVTGEPLSRPHPARVRRPGAGATVLAVCWMLTVGVMGGGAYAALHWRDAIAHGWPPSQRAYALLPGTRVG